MLLKLLPFIISLTISVKALGPEKIENLNHSLHYRFKVADALLMGEILSFSKPVDIDDISQSEILIKVYKTAGYEVSDTVNGNLFRVSLKFPLNERVDFSKIKLHQPVLLALNKGVQGYYLREPKEQLYYFERVGRELKLSYKNKLFSAESINDLARRYFGQEMTKINVDNLSYRPGGFTKKRSSRAPASIATIEKAEQSEDFYWVIIILTILATFSIKLCFKQD